MPPKPALQHARKSAKARISICIFHSCTRASGKLRILARHMRVSGGRRCAVPAYQKFSQPNPRSIMKKILITTLTMALACPFAFANTPGERDNPQKDNSQRPETMNEDAWNRDNMDRQANQARTEAGNTMQSMTPGSSDEVKTVSRDELQQKHTADKLVGSDVVDRSGERIGTIADLSLEGGEIRDAYVATGGVFGIGADTVRVPFEALEKTRVDNETAFRMDVQGDDFTSRVDEENTRTIDIGNEHQAEVVSNEDRSSEATVKNAMKAQLVDQSGQDIGQIHSIGIEESQVTTAYIELQRETRGDRLVQVPFDSLQSTQSGGELQYRVNLSAEELSNALRRATEGTAETAQAIP